MKRIATATTMVLLSLVLGAMMVASSAGAATSASGSQSLTGVPSPQLEATFPADYSFGTFNLLVDNVSTEQTLNVKSNKSWGVKVSSDDPSGLMRQWDGESYTEDGAALGASLEWANTSFGGVEVDEPTYSQLSSSQALIVGTKPKTGNAGSDVGVTYSQWVDYNDEADLGPDTYRELVTYDAAQGF